MPGKVHFQAASSQEDFYKKKKGEQAKKKPGQDNFGCSAFKISLDAITCVWPLRALVSKRVCPHKPAFICHVVFVLRLSRK